MIKGKAALLCALLLVLCACQSLPGEGTGNRFDMEHFVESYNRAAAQVGAAEIDPASVGPMEISTTDGAGVAEGGYMVEYGELTCGTLMFEPWRLWAAGRVYDNEASVLAEYTAIVMAGVGLSAGDAAALVNELYGAALDNLERIGSPEHEMTRGGYHYDFHVTSGTLYSFTVTCD